MSADDPWSVTAAGPPGLARLGETLARVSEEIARQTENVLLYGDPRGRPADVLDEHGLPHGSSLRVVWWDHVVKPIEIPAGCLDRPIERVVRRTEGTNGPPADVPDEKK